MFEKTVLLLAVLESWRNPKQDEAIPFSLNTIPLDTPTLTYGFRREPLMLTRLCLSPDLLIHLQNSLPFCQLNEAELLSDSTNVFFVNDDYSCGRYCLPGHHYYEGFYHAVSSKSHTTIDSMNARFGNFYEKPPAPVVLSAFLESFRQLNHSWISAAFNNTPLQFMESEGLLFADIAVQIHSGDAITGRSLAWHRDGPNHMAISLRGCRSL